MKAVVLAAGEGTRIRPLSERRPKPMLPVADRPLVAHAAAAAVDAGADELVVVVGYESAAVREYFGETYRGVDVSYAVQEARDGTAGAVRAARSHLDGSFAVLNGDNLYDPGGVAALFDRAPSVGAVRVPDPSNYGVLHVDDGTVTGVVEKPAVPGTDLANAGAYVFPGEAADWLDVPMSDRGEREITDVLDRVVAEYAVTPVAFEDWLDVGRPWELLAANEWKLGDLDPETSGEVSEAAHLDGDVVVESGASILPGTVIEGPALVRSGATVGPNAYVRGPTLLGRDVHVGHAVEVKNSVLMAGTNVGHLSYVGDSVIGRDVNFGAGTVVANLRHDGEDVEVSVKDEQVSTGRRKFGVVVGDDARTGIDTSLNAGVTLGTGVETLPGATVVRDR
jgi:bifunctional UDP-N-acetylglucosamine pyrophosphorylase/glucosamine-1-phosphate N-acetyltransferase